MAIGLAISVLLWTSSASVTEVDPAFTSAIGAANVAENLTPTSQVVPWSGSWGAFETLKNGGWWSGPSEVWSFGGQAVRENGLLNRGVREWMTWDQYATSGILTVRSDLRKDRGSGYRISTTWPRRYSPVLTLPDGSLYFANQNHALVLIDENTFEWMPGVVELGQFRADPRFATPASGRYRRLAPDEIRPFTDRVNAVALETQRQRDQASRERWDGFGQIVVTGLAITGVAAAGGDVSAVPLTGNPLDTLNAANAEIARQNAIGQAQVDATIAAAAQGQAPYATPVPSGANASGASGIQGTAAQARSSTTTQPLSFYFAVGLNPRQGQSRNPRCFSEVVTTSITYVADDPRSRGESIIAATDAYRASFIQECSRRGEVDSVNNVGYVNSITQGDAFGNRPHQARHPEDVYVRVQ